MRVFNIFLICLIVSVVVAVILRFILKKNYLHNDENILDKYDMNNVVESVKNAINQVLRTRPEDLNLDREQTEKIIKNKTKLRRAIREASIGDQGAKSYVKDYIAELLEKKLGINEITIENVIPFSNPSKLEKEERFEILHHVYKLRNGTKALEHIIKDYELDELRNDVYEITEEDIRQIYSNEVKELNYDDKLDILCQRVFELAYGNGIIDEIKDGVDGISGGVSGVPEEMIDYFEEGAIDENIKYSYDSVWLMFNGKPIYMPCIGFGSKNELIRVCRNIHKYNVQKPLTQSNPHVEGDMKDGSRIVVARPPFADSWSFSIRKHNEGRTKKIHEIITDTNYEIPIQLLEFIVKGNRTFLITGNKGTGKTTLLRSIAAFIRKTYRLQIQESVYELGMRRVFPGKYIMTFRDTPTITGEEALEVGRKWESEVSLLGEIVSYRVANWLIQLSQVASLMTGGTHHAKTTKSLIMWFRDARLTGENALTSEKYAEQECAMCINVDVHLAINEGHRYVERITEIIPVFTKEQYGDNYEIVDIMRFNEDKQSYELLNRFSEQAEKDMLNYFNAEEKKRYNELFGTLGEEGMVE